MIFLMKCSSWSQSMSDKRLAAKPSLGSYSSLREKSQQKNETKNTQVPNDNAFQSEMSNNFDGDSNAGQGCGVKPSCFLCFGASTSTTTGHRPWSWPVSVVIDGSTLSSFAVGQSWWNLLVVSDGRASTISLLATLSSRGRMRSATTAIATSAATTSPVVGSFTSRSGLGIRNVTRDDALSVLG